MGTILLIDNRTAKDGYRAWLTKVGIDDAEVSGKLRWKDRRLGKEVPRGQQYHFFDGAKDAEIDTDLLKTSAVLDVAVLVDLALRLALPPISGVCGEPIEVNEVSKKY